MASTYPKAWPQIAEHVKAKAGWLCERCGHPHDPETGHCLTVAHLDPSYGHQRWNLAALCQRCHLKYEHRFAFRQRYMFEHSEWMKPHVEGWERWRRNQRQLWVRVGLCCNSPDNGVNLFRLAGVNIAPLGGDARLRLSSNRLYDSERTTCRCLMNADRPIAVRIGRRTFPILGYREWFGNWCWNAVTVRVAVAARIANHLKTTGKFFCEEGANDLMDRWDAEGATFRPRDFVDLETIRQGARA